MKFMLIIIVATYSHGLQTGSDIAHLEMFDSLTTCKHAGLISSDEMREQFLDSTDTDAKIEVLCAAHEEGEL